MSTMVGHWSEGAIWRTTSGVFPSNSYFFEMSESREGILIDPGLDGSEIDAGLMRNNQKPIAVVCTHGHFDHAGSADYFQKKYGAAIYLPKNDENIFKASNFLLMTFKIPAKVIYPKEVIYVNGNSELKIGGIEISFKSTPGHTPGSCILQIEDSWFTGDTLYANGVGLSKLPGENKEQLKSSILNLWDDLTSSITIYPGHGNSANGFQVKNSNKALIQFLQLNNMKLD